MIQRKRVAICGFILILILTSTNNNLYSEETKDIKSAESVEKKSSSIFDILDYIPPKKKGPDEKIWSYSLGGFYARKLGNTDTLDTNLKTEFEIDDNISNFMINFSTFYGESDGEKDEKESSGIIKYDHYIIPRVELFAFSKSEYDEMALLQHRNNSGAGVKFIFIGNKFLKLDLSGAIIYQYENYETRRPDMEYRWSIRGRIKVSPVKGLVISCAYFYIPKISKYNRYRSDTDAYIKYKLHKYLSFKAGYLRNYNTDALEGTKKTDEKIYGEISIEI